MARGEQCEWFGIQETLTLASGFGERGQWAVMTAIKNSLKEQTQWLWPEHIFQTTPESTALWEK